MPNKLREWYADIQLFEKHEIRLAKSEEIEQYEIDKNMNKYNI